MDRHVGIFAEYTADTWKNSFFISQVSAGISRHKERYQHPYFFILYDAPQVCTAVHGDLHDVFKIVPEYLYGKTLTDEKRHLRTGDGAFQRIFRFRGCGQERYLSAAQRASRARQERE